MVNTLITPDIIAKVALFHLENNLVLGQNVYREYVKDFHKVGDTVTIRRPIKFVTSDGVTRVNQDVTEQTTSITLNSRKHVSFNFSSQELTLEVEDFAERYIKGAAITLANTIDRDLALEGSVAFNNQVGEHNNAVDSFSDLSRAARRLDDLAAPDDGSRIAVLDPEARWALADAFSQNGVFNAEISGQAHRKGYLGEVANLKIYGSQNLVRRQAGAAAAGTPVLSAAPANGASTVAISGGANSIAAYYRTGDVITFANVFAVNPVSFEPTNQLAEFTVTADAATDGGGAIAALSFTPALNDGSTAATAPYQNVSVLPANGAAVGWKGFTDSTASPELPQGQRATENLVFHKNALALVTVPLELPDSANFKANFNYRGFNIRVVADYDVTNDQEIIRFDVLYGVRAIYPDVGVRLMGQAA